MIKSMRMRSILLSTLLAFCGLAVTAAAQAPGAYPHLVLTNSEGDMAPPPSGPFDNSGVSMVAAGSSLTVSLSYQAQAQPNPNVLWGLLLSLQGTSFPTNITPPPLFTQPPFNFVFGPTLDAFGEASRLFSVPASLQDVEVFVQAITFDSTSIPNQQLSNGVRIQTTPPRYNVAFGFARYAAGLTPFGIEGVSSRDIDGDTLNTLKPLGTAVPPDTATDPPGFAPGFVFLPILPNVPDAPVNPLARPFTRLAENLTSQTGIKEIRVQDGSFFPPRGELFIQHAMENPFANKTSGDQNLPNLERVTYTGLEIDPISGNHMFTGVRRKLVGSTGSTSFPHSMGELVFGRYTFATSAGARARTRVALDATHRDTPHVVIPPFTADLGEGMVTRDQDLYLFEEVEAGLQGFAVLDRLTHSWHIIEDSVVDVATQRAWDPMVHIAPDGRSMIAFQHVDGGTFAWDNMPDALFAIRLDGLSWPASGSEVWEVSYELNPEPSMSDVTVESREVYMPSVAILGPDPDNYVAFVGLKSKWRGSFLGQDFVAAVGFEGAYIAEEVIVKEYIDIPLVPPGSSKGLPATPRPFITALFGETGNGQAITRFDPIPVIDKSRTRMFLAGGSADSIEDILVVRNVSIDAAGNSKRILQNISGLGTSGGTGESNTFILGFEPGGHGLGSRAVISPGGTRFAWLRRETANADFIMIARTNGSDYSAVTSVYKASSGAKFREPGPYSDNHTVNSMYFADEDNLVFLMGDAPHSDALGLDSANFPRFDLFRYTISTDTMVNLSRTSESPNDFDTLGKIRPAGSFRSDDGRFVYILRDGPVSQGNTTLPADVEVFNVLGLNLNTYQLFDVTGDEFGGGVGLPNLDIPDDECLSPVETAAGTRYVEGLGSQTGLRYFTSHVNGDATETDEIYMVDANKPFVAVEVTSGSASGSHISNLAPSPESNVLIFARTADSLTNVSNQHPFAVDVGNFLFQRDLTPAFQAAGVPFGRLVDGSIHFIPATESAGEAVVFAAGSTVLENSLGTATNTSAVYYPLANVSDPLAEPVPVLIPLLSANGLGAGYRLYLLSAGASANP